MEILLFIIACAAVFLLSAYLRSPKVKGRQGEARVSSRIQKILDEKNHVVLNDLTIPVLDGTTQIDHVVISPSGIFVIETKNMSGWIFGGKDQAQWTQTLRRQKFKFQNPLLQNYKHVKVVQDVLGVKTHEVHNVVVFAGSAVPKTKMPENVLWGPRALNDYFALPRKVVFGPNEISRMASELQSKAIGSGRDTDRLHVANLRARAAKLTDPNRCPKCGSELVERKNRKTGESFWGCSSFPKCRAVRRA